MTLTPTDMPAVKAAALRLSDYCTHHGAPMSAIYWEAIAADAADALGGCEASLASVQACWAEDDSLADEMARDLHRPAGERKAA